jgi:hypothetical protein
LATRSPVHCSRRSVGSTRLDPRLRILPGLGLRRLPAQRLTSATRVRKSRVPLRPQDGMRRPGFAQLWPVRQSSVCFTPMAHKSLIFIDFRRTAGLFCRRSPALAAPRAPAPKTLSTGGMCFRFSKMRGQAPLARFGLRAAAKLADLTIPAVPWLFSGYRQKSESCAPGCLGLKPQVLMCTFVTAYTIRLIGTQACALFGVFA